MQRHLKTIDILNAKGHCTFQLKEVTSQNYGMHYVYPNGAFFGCNTDFLPACELLSNEKI